MGFKDTAQKFVDMGFSIIPIIAKDKKPLLDSWRSYQKHMPSKEEIETWLKLYPEANIAVITGEISNLIVIDVDGQEGLDALKDRHLPPTLTVTTGRGIHYYYRMPSGKVLGNSVGILPKVDIRGEGGYVVAPGSIHPSGAVYSCDDLDAGIAECPLWVFEHHVKESEKKKKKDPDWISKIKKGVKEGGRNDACAKLAGYYIAKGYDDDDTLELLCSWNKKNQPELPEKEISAAIKSVRVSETSKTPMLDAPPVTLVDCKKTIARWLYHKDDNIVDVALAVINSVNHTSDPLWVILIGASSSGKTEILRGFQHHKDIIFLDNMTPATLVTGFTKAKGILEKIGSDPKAFVIQDFSTILSKPPYDRMQIVDTLRQVYNGSYYNAWGNGKTFTWQGKISLISGSTPDIESQHYTMAELGERFLYYRVESDDPQTRRLMMVRARAMEGKEKQARAEIAGALHGVLAHVRNKSIVNVTLKKEYCDWLDDLVDVTTTMRSPVKRNSYRREIIEYTPHKEGPGRMYKACSVLIKSLAVIRGKDTCDEEDYAVVVKVCLDSIPSIRREALKVLCKSYGMGGVRAKDVAQATGYQSTENIGYHLADLSAVGMVDRWLPTGASGAPNMSAPYSHEINESAYKKLEACGILDLL